MNIRRIFSNFFFILEGLETPIRLPSISVTEWSTRSLRPSTRQVLTELETRVAKTPESQQQEKLAPITSQVPGNTVIQSPQRILVSAEQKNTKGEVIPHATALYINTAIFSPSIPEYPKTSKGGVMYVIPLDSLSKDEIANPEQSVSTPRIFYDYSLITYYQIQYCLFKPFPTKDTTSAFLDNIPCRRTTFLCSGCKACKYLDSRLRGPPHTEVTAQFWKTVMTVQDSIKINSPRRQAIGFAQAIVEKFRKGQACLFDPQEYIDNGEPWTECNIQFVQEGGSRVSNIF